MRKDFSGELGGRRLQPHSRGPCRGALCACEWAECGLVCLALISQQAYRRGFPLLSLSPSYIHHLGILWYFLSGQVSASFCFLLKSQLAPVPARV